MLKNLNSSLKAVAKAFAFLWVKVSQVIGSVVLGFLVLVSFLAFLLPGLGEAQLSGELIREGDRSSSIAVVELNGVIVETSSSDDAFFSSGYTSSRDFIELLRELENDDTIAGVLIRINSPGGSAVASDDIYNAVLQLRQTKPVIAQMGDVAASGGYYVASAADTIVANRSTLTGSIGVIMQTADFSELYENIGIDFETIKSGELKDIGASDKPLSEEERAILQSVTDEAYGQFTASVAESRGLDIEQVRSLADGRVYTGQQAKELGLVDVLGNFETALAEAEKLADIENPAVLEFKQESLLDSLLSVRGIFNPLQFANPIAPGQSRLWYMASY